MRPEVRECNPGRQLRRRISVGTIRDISIKHDIKHVVSVPLKSNGSPLAGHVDLMPGPGRLQTRDKIAERTDKPVPTILKIACGLRDRP